MYTDVKSYLCLAVLAISLLIAPGLSAQGVDPGIPDTLRIDSIVAYTGSEAPVPVYFTNDEQLGGIEVTLTYDSPDVYIDSVSFVGSRVEASPSKGYTAGGNTVTFYVIAHADFIPVGDGLLATIYVGYPSTITPQGVNLDTITIINDQTVFTTIFSDENSEYFTPEIIPGFVEILESGCCIGDRGNINASPDDVLDISDIVYLVDYMFTQGPPPTCVDEANVNGDIDNLVDISDLVYLANYMFTGGPPPLPCH